MGRGKAGSQGRDGRVWRRMADGIYFRTVWVVSVRTGKKIMWWVSDRAFGGRVGGEMGVKLGHFDRESSKRRRNGVELDLLERLGGIVWSVEHVVGSEEPKGQILDIAFVLDSEVDLPEVGQKIVDFDEPKVWCQA